MEINLTYYSDLIDEDNISLIENKLKQYSITLSKNDISGRPQMSADDILSQTIITITPLLVSGIAINILSNLIYDALKTPILSIWANLKNKKITKHSANGQFEEKETSLGIKFRMNNDSYEMKIPLNLSDELKETCVTKMLSYIIIKAEQETKPFDPMLFENHIVVYNKMTQEWETIGLPEFIQKYIK
ncbi:hypothetical protein [Lelliottia wanjuensis]|uniref:hypothetical protein n=1 Tax=Lelliottia wanjuensis TaxID=3050585 RepID=UPI00254EE030|nr:hypothetical protein [Lelliottia sp. V86_10]MDK9583195.1 hypothetical protein [Lelliottia sp. V86_10]